MSTRRASIFEEPEKVDEIDLSGFTPKAPEAMPAPSAEQVRKVTETANFRSREPKRPAPEPAVIVAPAPVRREQRRYRTGRNVQFNVKASQETIDALYAISDRQHWVLGEALEHAVAALQRELARGGEGAP